MARDSGGTYTLPSGNPVVTATTITSTWANTTMDDIADALTDSLSRSGDGSMTSVLKLADGTVTSPGLQFGSDANTGIYRINADQMGITVGGGLRADWYSARVNITYTAAVDLTDNTNALNLGSESGAHLAFDPSDVQAKGSATTSAALNINQLGGNVNVGAQANTGTVNLYHNAALVVNTATSGIKVTGATDTRVDIEDGDGETGAVVKDNNGDFVMRNDETGADIYLKVYNGSAYEDVFSGVEGGAASLYHDATARVSTTGSGADVFGATLDLDNSSSANQTQARVRNSEGGVEIRTNGGNLFIVQTDSTGAIDQGSWIQGAQDGAVTIYHDDVEKFSTLTNGINVTNTTDAIVQLTDGDSQTGAIVKDNAGDFTMRNDETGGDIELLVYNGASYENVFQGLEGGASTLYFDGSAKLATETGGARITGVLQMDAELYNSFIANPQSAVDGMLVWDNSANEVKLWEPTNWRVLVNDDANNHTFTDDDMNEVRNYTGTGGNTFSMNTGIGDEGQFVLITNSGSGVLTIGGTATINSAYSLVDIPAGGSARLLCTAANTWSLSGNLQ